MMMVLKGISPSHIMSAFWGVGQGAVRTPREITLGIPRYWSPTNTRRLKLVRKERTLP